MLDATAAIIAGMWDHFVTFSDNAKAIHDDVGRAFEGVLSRWIGTTRTRAVR